MKFINKLIKFDLNDAIFKIKQQEREREREKLNLHLGFN